MKRFVFLMCVGALMQACTTTEQVDITVPEISLDIDASTPVRQIKSGVEVTLVVPQIEVKSFVDTRLAPQTTAQSLMKSATNLGVYPIQMRPVYYPSVNHLTFRLKIKNNLDRPLRLNGSIASIEMSDKIISSLSSDITEPQEFLPKKRLAFGGLGGLPSEPEVAQLKLWDGVSEQSMAEIHRTIILPGKEKEIEVEAPKHVNIPSKTSFAIGLLDVATKLDAASNPIEKQSFSWIVNYDRQVNIRSESVITENKQLNPIEYATMQMNNVAQ